MLRSLEPWSLDPSILVPKWQPDLRHNQYNISISVTFMPTKGPYIFPFFLWGTQQHRGKRSLALRDLEIGWKRCSWGCTFCQYKWWYLWYECTWYLMLTKRWCWRKNMSRMLTLKLVQVYIFWLLFSHGFLNYHLDEYDRYRISPHTIFPCIWTCGSKVSDSFTLKAERFCR